MYFTSFTVCIVSLTIAYLFQNFVYLVLLHLVLQSVSILIVHRYDNDCFNSEKTEIC
jgi:hypothetical protein